LTASVDEQTCFSGSPSLCSLIVYYFYYFVATSKCYAHVTNKYDDDDDDEKDRDKEIKQNTDILNW